jgi:hypothetical protein
MTSPEEPTSLSSAELAELRRCEATLRNGLQDFSVGSALAKIKAQKLYRAKYYTFEGYCQEQWSLRELFVSETIYPLERCEGWLMAGLGGLFVHANIGLAFNNASDVPFDMRSLQEVEWRGETIAISPLEWLQRDNQIYGRADRVELIERFMHKG